MRRAVAVVFAGDRRVWRLAALCAIPFVLLTAAYCVKQRPYWTGTDSVEDDGYLAVQAHAPLCQPGLYLPADTSFVRLRTKTPAGTRPGLRLALRVGSERIESTLPPQTSAAGRVSNADFPIPRTPARPAARIASLCVTSETRTSWAITALTKTGEQPPTVSGYSQAARVAVWFLPPAGARRSYLQAASTIFSRAALFRPGIVGAWTYPVLLFIVLPALAILAVRCVAIAVWETHPPARPPGARPPDARRLGAWVYAIAALNACCWALLTPVFQGPDEVDHFAYVQSIVERGEGPSHDPASPLQRWSGAENRALEDIGFFTDHQIGDSRPPWLVVQQARYRDEVAVDHPRKDNGGGYTTSAAHGPIYYLVLAPAYAAARGSSIFSQLTLMRLLSALIGAIVVVCTFALARELAPGRPWLWALAALLVAFEPMYGFISGVVNNDVGVNAGAAFLELLLIRTLRRGLSVRWGAVLGVAVVALPIIKGTGLSLYPVVGLVLLATLWRQHRREDLPAWLALIAGALLMALVSSQLLSLVQPAASKTGASAVGTNASAAREALSNIPEFLSYLWQVFLPRLPFMTPHFSSSLHPAFKIFIERGWAAFGWYTVYFPRWVYVAILVGSLGAIALAIAAARLELSWLRRHWLEAVTVVAMPVCVVLGFEAAYYTPGLRTFVPEFGRYAFPAIAPLALIGVGALHAFGRRRAMAAGVALLVAMISLSYASQLLTLTSFYA